MTRLTGRRRVREEAEKPLHPAQLPYQQTPTITIRCRSVTQACPCGYFTDPKRECHCTPLQIQKYLAKISGPLLDRIDMHLEVPSLKYQELTQKPRGEDSFSIRQRVEKTRAIQKKRYLKQTGTINAALSPKQIEKYCQISCDAQELLKMAIYELGLSARAYDKVLKLGRTIADMAGQDEICAEHIAEAISYRCLDRNLWAL